MTIQITVDNITTDVKGCITEVAETLLSDKKIIERITEKGGKKIFLLSENCELTINIEW